MAPAERAGGSGLTLGQLAWLVRLRWLALTGIVAATCLAAAGVYPGVNWPVLAAAAAAAGIYNASLWRSLRRGEGGQRAAVAQALPDFALLTVVLWAAGGIASPFLGYYLFHVVLAGILAGPRAALLAAVAAAFCTAALASSELLPALRIGRWQPVGVWEPITDVVALASTLAGVAYLVTYAMRELRRREQALERARDRAELEYELLSNTLNEIDAGLEVLDEHRRVIWRNRRALLLSPEPLSDGSWRCPGTVTPCERDVSASCPLEGAASGQVPGRCRFAVEIDGSEHVYELLAFPLSSPQGQGSRVMNLYLDRTSETLAERQLLLAERLASLGRVAQGVAHELNTPLTTIRTLAADMLSAVRSLPTDRGQQAVEDIHESAGLIRDETSRLGKITQELLAGGDLVRAKIKRAVPLGAAVERAHALVFAGVRDGPGVEIDATVDGLLVAADPDRLVQVLVNLLQNALDAVRGRPDARVKIAARRDEGGQVEILIDDDGPGLAPQLRNRLFEPFTTTKPPGEGTGLGLYTSYMLVRAMRGSLSLDDLPQHGTRATIRLPVSPA